jgi:hypothetical protein
MTNHVNFAPVKKFFLFPPSHQPGFRGDNGFRNDPKEIIKNGACTTAEHVWM